jgi:hypothetical protein
MLEAVRDRLAHLGIQEEDDDNLVADNNDDALMLHRGERITPAELFPAIGNSLRQTLARANQTSELYP